MKSKICRITAWMIIAFFVLYDGVSICKAVSGDGVQNHCIACKTLNTSEGCEVIFIADSDWRSNHPACNLEILLPDCDSSPEVILTGENCVQASGFELIGHIVVENPVCGNAYYCAYAKDGLVEVELMDDF